jgi:hypothetical protein
VPVGVFGRMRPTIPGLPESRLYAGSWEPGPEQSAAPRVYGSGEGTPVARAQRNASGSGLRRCGRLGLCSGLCVKLAPAMGQELVETRLRPAGGEFEHHVA